MHAIDIPVGMTDLSTAYRRAADAAARAFIRPAGSSVFSTPPREVLVAPNYQAALVVSRALNRGGISAQSYALGHKILEIDELAGRAPRPPAGGTRTMTCWCWARHSRGRMAAASHLCMSRPVRTNWHASKRVHSKGAECGDDRPAGQGV